MNGWIDVWDYLLIRRANKVEFLSRIIYLFIYFRVSAPCSYCYLDPSGISALGLVRSVSRSSGQGERVSRKLLVWLLAYGLVIAVTGLLVLSSWSGEHTGADDDRS